MAYTNEQLRDIGAWFSTQRMIEQGNVSVAVARAHAEDLGKKFPAAKVDELAGLVGQIQSQFETQAEAKTAYATGNVPVDEWITRAKAWLSDAIAAADNAFEEDPVLQDQFHKDTKIGRSVPKIAGRLQALLTLAETHKAALTEWGFGDGEIQEGRTILQGLTNADTEQEQAVRNMPKETQALNVIKGKAYLLLKRLARAGRRTYKDDPAMQDKFSLSILRRKGRRSGGGQPDSSSAESTH